MMPSSEGTRKKWIGRLRRVLNDAPDDLWLFCSGDQISVMTKKPDGSRAYSMGDRGTVDPDYELATIPIGSDGGDW